MSRRAEYWRAIGSEAMARGRAFVVMDGKGSRIAWAGRAEAFWWSSVLRGRRRG